MRAMRARMSRQRKLKISRFFSRDAYLTFGKHAKITLNVGQYFQLHSRDVSRRDGTGYLVKNGEEQPRMSREDGTETYKLHDGVGTEHQVVPFSPEKTTG